MATTLDVLIGRAHIEPYAQISQLLVDDKQLHPYTLAAQNLDIKPVLGNIFWTDLLANRLSTIYQTLLEGGTYLSGSDTYSFAGLYAAIASYTYARYVLGKNVQDTPFGFVQKESEYTNPVSDKSIAQKAQTHIMAGQQYLSECVAYLNANESTYPKYRAQGCGDRSLQGKGVIKLTGVSRF